MLENALAVIAVCVGAEEDAVSGERFVRGDRVEETVVRESESEQRIDVCAKDQRDVFGFTKIISEYFGVDYER